MEGHKTYLGDGVYVELSPLTEIVLTTENGINATNRIVLEPEVFANFQHWLTFVRTFGKRETQPR